MLASLGACLNGGAPRHVCFLEDTKLEGGTQIWVAEAARWFLAQGWAVTICTPAGGFNAADAAGAPDVRLVTYDYEGVEAMDDAAVALWAEAFAPCDVVVMTVHPPRKGGVLNSYEDGFFHVRRGEPRRRAGTRRWFAAPASARARRAPRRTVLSGRACT
jgi:hypothetical protein